MSKKLSMHQLLYNMAKTDASDLHIKVNQPPVFRIGGELHVPPGLPHLNADDTRRLILEIVPEQLIERYEQRGDLDFSTFQDTTSLHEDDPEQPNRTPKRLDRFRCNIFRAGGGMHAAIRRVKPEIPTFESLHLPPIYQKLADQTHEGLILVVGVTGSGKSTTLACMLERINSTRSTNIITIEDPVEYQIHPEKSVVSQREIGTDVPDYPTALKYIVRQDPDVIFIGELRDHDTVLAAVQAAETGHLVFGSLHTADTMQCFNRIIEFFPQNEHAFIRSSLAGSLKAVCAQRLLPATAEAGVGAVPATEVLINNASVREAIRDAEDSDIPAIVGSSSQDGMRSFTESLAELVESEMVTLQNALDFAPNRESLSSRLKGVEVKASKLTGRMKG